MAAKILIIDDEESIRLSLRGILEDEGLSVVEAESGEQGLELLGTDIPDLVFLDIWLPGMDGLEALETISRDYEGLPVIMISGHGTIETAVKALKKGAFDFIEKPLSLEKVVVSARNGLEFSRLRQENQALKTRISSEQPVTLTGESAPIANLREVIGRVAPTESWVLITGANGTGKEIVARSIHNQSSRADKPLVAVNCAAIPEELIESELFGHEKGAFTGAEKAQIGKFELADGSTLFLDEIGDMSLKTQAKILRILQEQAFEHVGGRKTIKVDVRVIAATNKDLPREIKAGNFREDLYYRLKVFPLELPPLRDRVEDIPLLINDFMDTLVRQHGFKPIAFAPESIDVLSRYPWPGNVRELKNFVERMFIMYAGETVTPDRLPPEFKPARPAPEPGETVPAAPMDGLINDGPADLKQARADFEARFLEAKLKEFDGNISQLAKAIGLERSSLYRKLKAYNIQAD
ncbi:MAG: sigma-54-dependent transcriptional regulator [Pseudodesulfovibrio sp.]|jgi:two-component system nitrogen regulation response regulator NtrX|uniref:Fis family transcriptional regulator n=1 Tax=Pseudodesulfovibrio indicus TaxID=1716143 RepID=A0A126QKY1_9BACT|nr:sigma-54 dependent transcriptional regulator [Pseudodesulfovibrio indicus]AMK10055.1 Fis family transcriptional regulator [Pseudodesulfovibrio indicus]TDT86975.1 two-component system nitrogen regulation response regulator NtrX [Pseudodesulfovibrio indicus]